MLASAAEGPSGDNKMLINDKEADKRLGSSQNLINKIKSVSPGKSKAMQLFGIGRQTITSPFSSPSSSYIEKKADLIQPVPPAATSTFTKQVTAEESEQSPLDDFVKNADDKIKMELIRSAATDALLTSVKQLAIQLPAMESPDKLANVASKMSRIINELESKDNRNKDGETVHYHFYMPEQRKIEQYEVIEVS